MTDDTDDLLAAYDLSAWDPPPPAPGLADAVIARARQPVPVVAVDRDEPPPRTTRRWWIAGVAAAVAVAAIAIGVWGLQRTPQSGQGEVIAITARTLSIGPTTAALDPGAEVRWRRDKRKISVAQLRGAAMWNVAADDTIVIDAGAMVASVEASGASLRVEVEMLEAKDARTIGISAATAVAVAFVTIVVYEGAVRVRHDGQTADVVAGARYTVQPPAMPDDGLAVGGGVTDEELRQIFERDQQIADQLAQLEEEGRKTLPDLRPVCDEVSCILNNYDEACCAKFQPPPPVVTADAKRTVPRPKPACDADALRKKGDDHLQTGMDAAALAAFEQSMRCRPDPDLYRRAFLAACRSKNGSKAKLYFSRLPTADQDKLEPMCVRNGIAVRDAARPACDADALRQKGDDHLQTGMDAAALAAFEQSMRCKPDPALYRRAFLAACRSKNAFKARLYVDKVPGDVRDALAQICLRNGIDVGGSPTPEPEVCNAEALSQKGDDNLQIGRDAEALAMFEKSLACKSDPGTTRKAFLAACRSKNQKAAQRHYLELPAANRSTLEQMCIRNGVQVSAPKSQKGVIKIASRPIAKVLLDGVDTGKTTPATFDASAGNHKLTLVIDGNKFTYSVNVTAGETTSLVKDLQ